MGKKNNRKKRRYASRKRNTIRDLIDFKRLLLVIAAMAACLVVFVFTDVLPPTFGEAHDRPWLRIAAMLAISGVILGVAVIWNPERATLTVRILTLAIILLFLIPDHRMYVLFAVALACAMVGYVLFHWIKYEKLYCVQGIAFCFLGILSLGGVKYCNYVENPNGLHFGLVSLILAIVVIVLTIVICVHQKYPTGDCIAYVICVPLLSWLAFYATMNSLNYSLDFSEPTEMVVEIEDKEVHVSSGKGTTTHYELAVEIDGNKVILEVSEAHYDDTMVGDDITVSCYNGFFRAPYYIVE
jgi:hypothetical protein